METVQYLLGSSFVWALPLVLFGGYFWLMQHRADQKRRTLGTESDQHTAEEVAAGFLRLRGLESIPVEPGQDHSRNVCDPETGQLLIAPSFWETRTVAGTAMALRAAGLTAAFHLTPERIRRIRRLDIGVQVMFWFSFTVMGFGLMGGSLPVTGAAYGLFALTVGLFFVQLSAEKKLDVQTLRLVRERHLVAPEKYETVEALFHADRLVFGNRCCVVERPHDPEIREKIPAAAFSSARPKNNRPQAIRGDGRNQEPGKRSADERVEAPVAQGRRRAR